MKNLSDKQITDFFHDLEQTKPIIKSVRGINNKETYYHADRVLEVLEKHYREGKLR